MYARLSGWLTLLRRAQALLNAPDITTTKGLRARAIIAVLLGCALRRCEVATLADGRSSDGFTAEATGRRTHANTPDVFVWCLRCPCSSRHPARDLRASPLPSAASRPAAGGAAIGRFAGGQSQVPEQATFRVSDDSLAVHQT